MARNDSPVEFGLLGPFTVKCDDVVIEMSRGKERAVLAILLIRANQVVLVRDLAEELWGGSPPPSATMTIRNYIKRLRQVLGEAGGQRIRTRPGGYLIRVEAGELDVARFEQLALAVQAAARVGDWPEVSRQARAALSLWRGDPLADAGSAVLAEREGPRLTEMRLHLLENRLDADLRCGDNAGVIPELRRLLQEHPLRERLHATLMLALYQGGQQGDALAVYRNARQSLVGELGVEPGPGLRDLHQRILAADPLLSGTGPASLEQTAPRPAKAASWPVTPRELPPAVPRFTGRSAELQTLTRILDRGGVRGSEAIVISAIGGTAGVGKTALAVQWAYQVADRFPDGQLYVNLHGYGPAQPIAPGDALGGFLRAMGVSGSNIPAGADERAARYRSLLADKRMLIVLDNAGSADQIRPLLPGSAACTVVVTSRDALTGLVAADGAIRLDLDVLPPREAVSLLRTLIGARVDAEPAAAADLTVQCCGLPLALRLAAELAVSQPAMSLAGLVSDLADLRTRLDALDAGSDPRSQVRTVFSWSYRHLDAGPARFFRLLALHPGPDVEPYAAAALAGTTVPQARQALDVLVRAHLTQVTTSGRHGLHDLLRGYAIELTASLDTDEDRNAALTRLFDYYLRTASAAMDILFPAEQSRPRIVAPAAPVLTLAGPAAARHWLDAELAALTAAAAHMAGRGWPGHATGLAATLARYLRNSGRLSEAMATFGHALYAARRTGDRDAEITALINIGGVHWRQSRYDRARDRYQQALELSRDSGDRGGQARALTSLGLVETAQDRYEQAACYQQEAIVLFHAVGDRFGEARAVGNLGLARQRQGRYQEGVGYHRQALRQCREIGDREGETMALARLGTADLRRGRHHEAAVYLQQALAVCRDTGDAQDEAEILDRLGHAWLGLGRYGHAAAHFAQALLTSREVGDADLESDALNGLGDLHLRVGELGQAREHHAAALRLAAGASVPWQQARAHAGLAQVCQADGDPGQARYHWHEAFIRYTAIGAPEAHGIGIQLTAATDGWDFAPRCTSTG
jgi:DNA-binding SARP family transcriptional activator/tetratricopeptide (TPR) repeat protein